METAGAAVIISDSQLTADLLRETVEGILGDPTLLGQMSAASAGLARPHAAADVAGFVRDAAEGSGS
jgi:UDP-N-acetylglucosamine:LPS N-acetylglucosamine transferase